VRRTLGRLLCGGILLCAAFGCYKERLEFQEMPLGLTHDMELQSQNGIREKLMHSLAPATLLFFGFTRCPDFCPLTLHKIQTALKDNEANEALAKKTRVLFISVDHEHEKSDEIKNFLSVYPYARGFTGTKNEIAKIEKAFGAYSKMADGKLSHSVYTYLLNPQGKVIYLLRPEDTTEKFRQAIAQAAN
jgi:protein SCO1